jgi:hypothetical protein
MDNQTPPRDDDPSDMTDFEKNTTFEELQQLEQDSKEPEPDRFRQERENRGRDKQQSSGR